MSEIMKQIEAKKKELQELEKALVQSSNLKGLVSEIQEKIELAKKVAELTNDSFELSLDPHKDSFRYDQYGYNDDTWAFVCEDSYWSSSSIGC